jgi:hypothetical protein
MHLSFVVEENHLSQWEKSQGASDPGNAEAEAEA